MLLLPAPNAEHFAEDPKERSTHARVRSPEGVHHLRLGDALLVVSGGRVEEEEVHDLGAKGSRQPPAALDADALRAPVDAPDALVGEVGPSPRWLPSPRKVVSSGAAIDTPRAAQTKNESAMRPKNTIRNTTRSHNGHGLK